MESCLLYVGGYIAFFYSFEAYYVSSLIYNFPYNNRCEFFYNMSHDNLSYDFLCGYVVNTGGNFGVYHGWTMLAHLSSSMNCR